MCLDIDTQMTFWRIKVVQHFRDIEKLKKVNCISKTFITIFLEGIQQAEYRYLHRLIFCA